MKKLFFVLLAVLVLLFVQGCFLLFVCVEFEGLTVGTEYHYGDTFSEGTTKMELIGFYWSGATTPTTNGHMTVDGQGLAGGSGNDVNLNNISLSFDFCCNPSGLTLKFGEYGGNINLKINGQLENKEDFFVLNGSTVAGVSVTVTDLGGGKGTLKLDGKITSFAIGGQELWIDSICPTR